MKYYCVDEKSLECAQNGTGILVKTVDANNQNTCNYGYGIFDPQTHKVFLFKEAMPIKEEKLQFYSTKF